jgi:hypothetical protein
MVAQAHATGAEVLARLPSNVTVKPVRTFPDGSFWANLYPSDYQRRKSGTHLLVRIIPYTIKDPALPGYGEVHRLVTTLMDPVRDIARKPLPMRRNRSNPRVVKRKMSKFRLKRPEHSRWPQPSMSFRQSVVVI